MPGGEPFAVQLVWSATAGPTREYYLNRPVVNGADDRGGAMALLAAIEVEGNRLRVGGGATDRLIAIHALQARLSGLEFLIGIPGGLGGAIRMNAGAFGGETAEIVERVIALDPEGRRHELTADALGFRYRHSELPEGWIVVGAVLPVAGVAAFELQLESRPPARSAMMRTPARMTLRRKNVKRMVLLRILKLNCVGTVISLKKTYRRGGADCGSVRQEVSFMVSPFHNGTHRHVTRCPAGRTSAGREERVGATVN